MVSAEGESRVQPNPFASGLLAVSGLFSLLAAATYGFGRLSHMVVDFRSGFAIVTWLAFAIALPLVTATIALGMPRNQGVQVVAFASTTVALSALGNIGSGLAATSISGSTSENSDWAYVALMGWFFAIAATASYAVGFFRQFHSTKNAAVAGAWVFGISLMFWTGAQRDVVLGISGATEVPPWWLASAFVALLVCIASWFALSRVPSSMASGVGLVVGGAILLQVFGAFLAARWQFETERLYLGFLVVPCYLWIIVGSLAIGVARAKAKGKRPPISMLDPAATVKNGPKATFWTLFLLGTLALPVALGVKSSPSPSLVLAYVGLFLVGALAPMSVERKDQEFGDEHLGGYSPPSPLMRSTTRILCSLLVAGVLSAILLGDPSMRYVIGIAPALLLGVVAHGFYRQQITLKYARRAVAGEL